MSNGAQAACAHARSQMLPGDARHVIDTGKRADRARRRHVDGRRGERLQARLPERKHGLNDSVDDLFGKAPVIGGG